MHACPRSSTPRDRFLADPTVAMRLTDRDRQIICEVYGSRLLSRDQLIALGFLPSVGRANTTLRRLFDHGYLRRIPSALGPFGAQAIYAIGPNASNFVAAEFGIDRKEVLHESRKSPGRLLIEHTLQVHELRLTVLECGQGKGWGVTWVTELFARHEYSTQDVTGRWTPRVLKPDAFVTLTAGGVVRSFLIEVDLGNASRPAWKRSVLAYEAHAALGLVSKAYGVEHAAVLTVTTGGDLRLRHLMEGVPAGSTRYLFTTFKHLAALGVEGLAYLRSGHPAPVCLMDSGNEQGGGHAVL